jgi:hypothetical protein
MVIMMNQALQDLDGIEQYQRIINNSRQYSKPNHEGDALQSSVRSRFKPLVNLREAKSSIFYDKIIELKVRHHTLFLIKTVKTIF